MGTVKSKKKKSLRADEDALIRTRFLTAYEQVRIREDLHEYELSQILGMYETALHGLKKGTRNAQADWMSILCAKFHINGHWLLTGYGDMAEEAALKERVRRLEKRLAKVEGLL